MTTADEIIIGRSDSVSRIRKIVEEVADQNNSLLISGESGTGKHLVATALYKLSTKYNDGFIQFNCAASADVTFLERELFGYKKGAFRGADRSKKGILQAANRCTVLFENLDEAPLDFQVRLLRFIMDHQFSPIGDTRSIPVDCRVLSTNSGLIRDRVHAGLVREDFYYRLNVIEILIPPLRNRAEDIHDLVSNFVTLLGKDPSRFLLPLAKQGLFSCFEEYPWPGNVKELKATVDRMALSNSQDDAIALLLSLRRTSTALSVERMIEFPPEYRQAGISILSFFGEVLRRKYSDYKGVVRIEQEGLKVRMVVEPIIGKLEVFESALDEYGLVISGKMTPEQFTDDPYLVVSLKHELRMAQARIESQKELLSYQGQRLQEKERLIADFVRLIGQALNVPKPTEIKVEVSPNINANFRVNFDVSSSVNKLAKNLAQLGKILANGGHEHIELDQIRNELELIKNKDAEAFKQASVMKKISSLIKQLGDVEEVVGKFIRTAKSGISAAQNIARYYNEIASWCGLPQVPRPFLGNNEKA